MNGGDFYLRRRLVALGLLERYGTSVTLRHCQPGTYDPASGQNSPTWSQYSLAGLVRDYRQEQVDGSLVQSGDREIVLAAAADIPAPAPGDRLELGGHTYTIVQVKTLEPGGLPLLHQCQIRRA